MRVARASMLVGVCVVTACSAPPTPEWVDGPDHRWRELVVPRRGATGFEVVDSRRSGIDFANAVDREAALRNRHLTHGSGVALGDVDGDGLVDVFLARLQGPNALYRNLGDWRFEDITGSAGVAAPDRLSTGAVFADVEGDGDLDLLLTALGGPNGIFVNDGSGRFRERALDSPPDSTGSTTLALADVDGDGDLDLYVTNYKLRSAMDVYGPEERRFERIVQETGTGFRVAPGFESDFRVFERTDLDAVGYVQRAEADAFYLNDGQGRYERSRFTSGRFLDERGEPLSEEPDYFGLTARFQDVDGDGAPDLFVANDFEDPDFFWLNDGAGGFRAAPPLTLRATSNAGMAVDFSDVDRDGDVDFLEVDMLALDRELRMRQVPTHTVMPDAIGVIEDRPQRMRNTLFLNRGDATFAQAAELAGLEASGWSWATMFMDVDLDGYEDVLVTTGHAWDIMDADTQRRLGTLDYDWREEFLLFPDLDRPNRAFRNGGDLTFAEMGEEWGFALEADVSHGLASADLDLDGDLDLVVTRLDRPALLLRNRSAAPRLSVRLLGRPPNTQGIGAVVTLRGVGPAQRKEVTSGGMYLSGSDPTVTFAAPPDTSLVLEVRWRNGRRTRLTGVRGNRMYEIRQPAGAPEPVPVVAEASRAPYFEDATALLGHTHVESPYDDYGRQPLLPNRLSRLGPGITWTDVDGDGREDLVVPSGRGGALAVMRNTSAGFVRRDGAAATVDQTVALPVPGSGDAIELLVGQSSYESPSPVEAFSIPSVVRGEAGPVGGVVPGDTTSIGPLAAADVDGDGDLDLFVGARVVPAAYPLSLGSRMYRREAEGFVLDRSNLTVLRGLGMVSAATFSDVDRDGDPDLLVAVEWGTPVLLLNDDGSFRRAGDEWGLSDATGRWNGVATGDLDADGRPDVILTGWGANTRFRPEPERPLVLIFGDLDRNGSLDLIRAQRDEALGGLAPVDRYERLTAAIPALSRQVTSVRAFAGSTVDDLFGPGLERAGRYEATTLEHRVYLNRGGRFEARALPLEAQLAPAFYAGVADFDGDGAEDVFIAQNFFPTDPDSPRLDGGRSLWLRGDGRGGLEAVPGHVSGVQVWGDARGAGLADFDADGRVDLAVAQNGATTRLFRNVGGRPGLRVRLQGVPGNPQAIGAELQLVRPGGTGPVREVKAGSGYWSVDGAVQVLGGVDGATAVRVRWPGGEVSEVPIPRGATELRLRAPATQGSEQSR